MQEAVIPELKTKDWFSIRVDPYLAIEMFFEDRTDDRMNDREIPHWKNHGLCTSSLAAFNALTNLDPLGERRIFD